MEGERAVPIDVSCLQSEERHDAGNSRVDGAIGPQTENQPPKPHSSRGQQRLSEFWGVTGTGEAVPGVDGDSPPPPRSR